MDSQSDPRPRKKTYRLSLSASQGIFILLLIYMLDFTEPVLLPVTCALLISLLLRAPLRMLRRAGLPRGLCAMMLLLVSLGGAAVAFYMLAKPAGEWLERAPHALSELEWKLRELKEPIEAIKEAGARIESVTAMATDGEQAPTIKVELRGQKLTDVILGATPGALAAAATILILMFYILVNGDNIVSKLKMFAPSAADEEKFLQTIMEIETEISRFLLTIGFINLCLGIATTAVLYAYGVPNSALWGAVVGLLNFAPYIGAALSTALLAIVGLMSFDELNIALGVPALFLVLTTIEGYVVTPNVLGRTLALNPLAIFVALLFWGWLWGLAGVLLAVPMLTIATIVCNRFENLVPVAELLSRPAAP